MKLIQEAVNRARELGISDTDILNSIAKAIDELVDGTKPVILVEKSKVLLSREQLEIEVTETLQKIGMPAHIKGYKYTRHAIIYCLTENCKAIESVTKELYPQVAQHFNTTQSRVERAIRHAVEVSWDRVPLDTIDQYFGKTVDPNKGKPTNSEFIAKMVDYFKLKYEIR